MDLGTEQQLIRQAKRDPEAFGCLYDEYYPKIFGYILKRVADIDIAQDITSETFFKAVKNLWQFRWQNVSFSAWLYRIAGNETVNYYRKNRHYAFSLDLLLEQNKIEPVSEDNPEAEIIEAEDNLKKHRDFLKIHKKLSLLDSKYQEVIVLRFFEKKKLCEISKILAKPEGTIKSLLHRSLGKLKRAMGEETSSQPFKQQNVMEVEVEAE